jgi:hypothetical protein
LAACKSQNPGGTVARVNGSNIPLSEFENAAGRVASMPGKDFSTNEARRELLGEVIKQELLFQAGMKAKIVERSERLKKEIAREYLTEKIGKDPYQPTDKEIEQFYEGKKADLDKVRASHILIKPKSSVDPKSWDEAKAKAEMILKKIQAQGAKADFAKFAQQYSEDDANKDKGGELFFFERKKMVPEFSETAFAMKVGEIKGPVKTQFGFHIIKVTGEQRGLDAFKQSIKWQLVMEKRKEKADKLFADLKSGASVKIYDDVLAKANIQKAGQMMSLPPMHPPIGNAGAMPPGAAPPAKK